MGVKFENESYVKQRYTRTIYASDIEAAQNGTAELSVSIIYKMTIINESRTLAISPKEITNYFDNRYTIESVYSLSGAQVKVRESRIDTAWKVATIEYEGQIAAEEQDSIYIRFSVSQEAIVDLLNQKSTYHNAAQVNKYSSYYTAGTGKIDGQAYMSDSSEAGSIYAGIDEDSAPGNILLKLAEHESDPEGTKILDTSEYEDDEDSAPSLILEAGEERAISGIVWEDRNAKSEESNERVGDGIYDKANEKTIANVQLELWEVQKDANGNITGAEQAKYTNGDLATVTTHEDGTYTFGYKDEETGEYVGILPGTYFIKYVYDNESYIVTEPENIDINALEYKSTIVNFTVNETKINEDVNILKHDGGDKWYLIEERDAANNVIRYSDAVDNMSRRDELTESIGTINNAT